MKGSIKSKIAHMTSHNVDLNRKVMNMKKSFDEVNRLLQSSGGKSNKKTK